MTKKELQCYKGLCRDIKDLESRIKRKEKTIDEVEHGVVVGSLPDFPYTRAHFNISGYNISKSSDRKEKLEREKEAYNGKIAEYEKRKDAILTYINSIDSPEIAQIFRLTFLDGLTQHEVGEAVGLDRSRVSRKIDDYLKTHTKHKKS